MCDDGTYDIHCKIMLNGELIKQAQRAMSINQFDKVISDLCKMNYERSMQYLKELKLITEYFQLRILDVTDYLSIQFYVDDDISFTKSFSFNSLLF